MVSSGPGEMGAQPTLPAQTYVCSTVHICYLMGAERGVRVCVPVCVCAEKINYANWAVFDLQMPTLNGVAMYFYWVERWSPY